jgi:hypothetical protein
MVRNANKEIRAMRYLRRAWIAGWLVASASLLAPVGCYNTPVDVSELARGPAPLRMPSPAKQVDNCCYEDSLTGGEIFTMYCNYCHNSPALAERSFANFRNVAAHMRVRANLTGKEYAKLMEFLRRWNDVPPPDAIEANSPKRFFFGQPIPELKDRQAKTGADPVSGPRPGATDETSPGQPTPGYAPREAR